MQAVGTDDELEGARRRALEAHRDRIATVVECGDAVVEQILGRRLCCAVKQFDEVVAKKLDIRVVDDAAGRG
jgi:hypothetical protein